MSPLLETSNPEKPFSLTPSYPLAYSSQLPVEKHVDVTSAPDESREPVPLDLLYQYSPVNPPVEEHVDVTSAPDQPDPVSKASPAQSSV
jgi:hypothetical protein